MATSTRPALQRAAPNCSGSFARAGCPRSGMRRLQRLRAPSPGKKIAIAAPERADEIAACASGSAEFSPEQLAFLERKRSAAAPDTSCSSPPSASNSAPLRNGHTNGFSAEQLGFLERKNGVHQGNLDPQVNRQAISVAPEPSNGFSAEQLAFLERKGKDTSSHKSSGKDVSSTVSLHASSSGSLTAKQDASPLDHQKENLASRIPHSDAKEQEAQLRNDGSRILGIGYKSIDMELAMRDPGLNQQLLSSGHSISQLWTQDMWETHRYVKRYWRHMAGTWESNVFRRAIEPTLLITAGAAILGAWNTFAPSLWSLPALYLAPITHTISGSLLSLMLVFRTNNANARVNEARSLLATMIKCTRDLVRMSQYVPQATGGCREQLLYKCQAFPYALLGHIRKGRTREYSDDPTAFRVDPLPHIRRIMGADAAVDLLRHKDGNVPAHLLMDMSTVMHKALTIGMSTQIHQQVELVLKELSHVVAGAEKLLSTPIPVSYTRHTSRTVIIWLATLPLVLWPMLGWSMLPVMFVLTWLMIGVDEIGVQLEEPFCVLPAQPLCEMVEQEVISMSKQALDATDFKPAPKK